MKNLAAIFLFLFIIALLVPACKQKTETTKKTITTATKKNDPVEKPTLSRNAGKFIYSVFNIGYPYCWVEDGVVKGCFVEIMQEIIQKRLSLTFIVKVYPWQRVQLMVQAGYADAMITAYLPVRQKYSLASQEVVLYYDLIAFTRINHPRLTEMRNIKTLEDTKPFKHGHYFGAGWAEANLNKKGYKVDWVGGFDLCLQKLAIGRFDLFIENSIAIRANAKKLGLWQKITPLPTKFANLPFHVLISKKSQHTKLLPKIDDAIKAMMKDGTFKAIMSKY